VRSTFADAISPPPGYANTGTRIEITCEGASAPDARPAYWSCGHPLAAHTRDEATVCFRQQQNVADAHAHTNKLPTFTAADICATAAQLVGGDRQVTHGDKTINSQNTADAWNALLRAKLRRAGITDLGVLNYALLDALDVANMLELFKIARRYSGSHNLDDYIDGAGYAGCAGEIAEKMNASHA